MEVLFNICGSKFPDGDAFTTFYARFGIRSCLPLTARRFESTATLNNNVIIVDFILPWAAVTVIKTFNWAH